MFNNKSSLQEIIPRIARKRDVKNLYIAAHGEKKAIYGSEEITHRELANILKKIPKTNLRGLYLGTCLTVNMEMAEFLLKRSGVEWVAGYSEEIDWLESTFLDLFFWATYYKFNESKRKRIHKTVDEMYIVGGLCEDLGFNIYVRKKGPGGGVKTLLEYKDDEDNEDND